eukprot:6179090-Pleurochrysis_carterae.AAC.7
MTIDCYSAGDIPHVPGSSVASCLDVDDFTTLDHQILVVVLSHRETSQQRRLSVAIRTTDHGGAGQHAAAPLSHGRDVRPFSGSDS